MFKKVVVGNLTRIRSELDKKNDCHNCDGEGKVNYWFFPWKVKHWLFRKLVMVTCEKCHGSGKEKYPACSG